ncbi:unnamed protein product [Soboliphyme baturini]|uniref:BEN domain-containing protein n=1 Tax=Soboliphyme baturini TaxID=241478 RepID=A0A183JA70_9BILA|nr:unnamed protein product [Soboliphyme baturini]
MAAMMNGDCSCFTDVDDLLSENRYLKEQLCQLKEENCMTRAILSKYKKIVTSKKNSLKSLITSDPKPSRSARPTTPITVVSLKQIEELVQNDSGLNLSRETYHQIIGLLLDTLKDKNMAISHGKKTNNKSRAELWNPFGIKFARPLLALSAGSETLRASAIRR